jgi:cell wall-associated NlpC family hydrolase
VCRLFLPAIVFSLLVAPAAAAPSAAAGQEAWARSAISLVTSRGIFPGRLATFRPAAPLERGALAAAVARLGGSSPAAKSVGSSAPVTIAGLDATLVDALGLRAAARDFTLGAVRAGLHPPARFGTEVVARLLGLRNDLPIADDRLELQPQQTATRADAAFSAARVITLGYETSTPAPAGTSLLGAADAAGGVQYVEGLARSFALPPLTSLQSEVIGTAVSLIGYPYVWGGDDERLEPGFDCSGLVWRVFKLASYSDAPGLSGTLVGRTAAQMAMETPKSERVHRAELEPGDVVFFYPGPHSRPKQIDHTAIYLGNGWLIESSGQGVSLGRLEWYDGGVAWARRPLAEAGLEAWPPTPSETDRPAATAA